MPKFRTKIRTRYAITFLLTLHLSAHAFAEGEPSEAPAETTSGSSASAGGKFGIQAALGIPHLLRYGLTYLHDSRDFSIDLNYGSVGASAAGVSLTFSKLDVTLRWYPYAGVFFVGAGLGRQSLTAEANSTFTSQTAYSKIDITSTVFTPQIGWNWSLANGGFFFGLDFGYQTTISSTAALTTSASPATQATAEYQTLEANVGREGRKIGEIGLPVISLFRLGYLF